MLHLHLQHFDFEFGKHCRRVPAKPLGSIFVGHKVIPQSMSLESRTKIVSVRDTAADRAPFSPLHRGQIADALFVGELSSTGDRWLSLNASARISRCDAMREMRNPPLFGLVCCRRTRQHTRRAARARPAVGGVGCRRKSQRSECARHRGPFYSAQTEPPSRNGK